MPCRRRGSPAAGASWSTAIGAWAIAPVGGASAQISTLGSGSLTKEQRDRMAPGQVLDELKRATSAFEPGTWCPGTIGISRRSSAAGKFPAAVNIGCIDSRAPAEIIFDAGIGDGFSARIAGNVVNDDLLGSLEFACAVAGAKVLLLFGPTSCGAIKGAIDDVEMGDLTGLLARVKPAISATTSTGRSRARTPRTSTRSHEATSSWASTTSAGEVRSWPTWRRSRLSRSWRNVQPGHRRRGIPARGVIGPPPANTRQAVFKVGDRTTSASGRVVRRDPVRCDEPEFRLAPPPSPTETISA